jgi:hypothetical protein
MAATLLVARETFTAVVDGREVVVRAGETRVPADHPLVKGRRALFEDAAPGPDAELAVKPKAKPRRRARPTS